MSTPIDSLTAAVGKVQVADPAHHDATSTTTPAPSAEHKPINAATNEAVLASAAEGRRLYIGNLAYATTETELKEFFKGYLM